MTTPVTSAAALNLQRRAELIKKLRGSGAMTRTKRARKKAKRALAPRRRRNPGLKRWAWLGVGLAGAGLMAGALFRPVRGLLRGLGIGGVDHPEAWAVDRSAAALDEAAAEVSDSSVATQFRDLSKLAASGELWAKDKSAAQILIETAAWVQAAPRTSARLRLFMADRGVSWKSGGSPVTETEYQLLESEVGWWGSVKPSWRISPLLMGGGATLVAIGIVGAVMSRRKK